MATESTSKGWEELLKRIGELKEERTPLELNRIMDINAGGAVQKIKAKAPVNDGQLKSSAFFRNTQDFKDIYGREVVVGAGHAGYVEFGTGRKVRVPAELQPIASELRGSPSGRSLDEAFASIRDWARKKGIDEDDVYPIFASIMRNGITPHPFFYPAIVSQRRILYKDLEEFLDRETKRLAT